MSDKVIPIKHGTPNATTEAYANLETLEVEDVSWDKGPSNSFNASSGKIVSRPYTEQGGKNFDTIFRKKKETDK